MAVFAEGKIKRLYEKASGAILCQAPHHETDHGNADPGFLTGWEHFVVLGKSAPSEKPRERALHDPTPFEDVKTTGPNLLPIDDSILGCPDATQAAPGMLHNLHLPTERLLDPLNKACAGYMGYPPGTLRVNLFSYLVL